MVTENVFGNPDLRVKIGGRTYTQGQIENTILNMSLGDWRYLQIEEVSGVELSGDIGHWVSDLEFTQCDCFHASTLMFHQPSNSFYIVNGAWIFAMPQFLKGFVFASSSTFSYPGYRSIRAYESSKEYVWDLIWEFVIENPNLMDGITQEYVESVKSSFGSIGDSHDIVLLNHIYENFKPVDFFPFQKNCSQAETNAITNLTGLFK